MRYYNLRIKTEIELFSEAVNENCKRYGYDNYLIRVNGYTFQTFVNDIMMVVYREENNVIYSIFSYDEKNHSFDEAYDYIMDKLRDVTSPAKLHCKTGEITMYDYYNCLLEASRRNYTFGSRMQNFKAAKLELFEYDNLRYDNKGECIFNFHEKIIDTHKKIDYSMFSESFMKELANIESHKNESGNTGNMVHYVISTRSVEAASNMVETLMQKLVEANRISGHRMEIISEIRPDAYKYSYLEDVIENNTGGVIVIDLSEKFGHEALEYELVSKHIENLVKKHRKKCLFVFTYNMDKPGFAYSFLPNIKKYVIPVMLREGTGDRKSATKYMKNLIEKSEYSEYANQAKEFMKEFSSEKFTQTDVMEAYEKFEPWCLNKNIYSAYDYNIDDDFMLDRDENIASSEERLNELIGLEKVKEHIGKIVLSDIAEKERKNRVGNSYKPNCMHMIFAGNPGSAKTTVARLFAGIAKEKGILKSGAFVSCGGMDFDGLGCVQVIRNTFKAAKGGVLFIDEAYSLQSDTATTVLIQEMEEHREDVIVVLAGYNERMKGFMEQNEGLKSRIPHWVDFPDYNADELTDIFKLMLKDKGFTATDSAIKEAYYIFEKAQHIDNFGNGRYVRNILEEAIMNQSVRVLSEKNEASEIKKKELFMITKDDISELDEARKEDKEPKKELSEMIGLTSAKKVIHKAIANLKLKKICAERGLTKEDASYHMVFTGNPGTAKTSVARLFAEILKEEGVLPTGNFIEVGRADLVGKAVGHTAPLVKKRFKEAQGGVLFIDEAYSLNDGLDNGYGDEAINTIVQEMENHRDDVIVIFAGYPKPMEEFLDRNPGMSSRIAFHVNFEDYTVDELCDITRLMVNKKKMTITDSAMTKVRENIEAARKNNDFGNGRYVRKLLEESEMNIAERVYKLKKSDITTEMITTIEECDVPEYNEEDKDDFKKIGFCA